MKKNDTSKGAKSAKRKSSAEMLSAAGSSMEPKVERPEKNADQPDKSDAGIQVAADGERGRGNGFWEKIKRMDFFTKMTWIMVIFSAIVVILFVISTRSSMAGRSRGENSRGDGSGGVINVSVQRMAPETFRQDLSVNADLKSLNGSVTVMSPVNGTLVRNFVRLGDRVEMGDELGLVDASDIGLNYNIAPVTAKSDGVITSIGASVNQKVTPATALYVIEPDPDFVLSASVSESDADSLKLGTQGYFVTAGDSSKRHTATLTYIAPSVNPANRTVAIELAVGKDEGNAQGLRAGSFVELHIAKNEIANAFVVPKDAVRTYAGEDVVYVVDGNGNARRIAVTAGLSTQSQVVIESGLSEGDAVIIQGSPQDGDKVQIL